MLFATGLGFETEIKLKTSSFGNSKPFSWNCGYTEKGDIRAQTWNSRSKDDLDETKQRQLKGNLILSCLKPTPWDSIHHLNW